MDTPLVSIGIPTYNRYESLRKCLESALTQEYKKTEIVVSDNASTDQTEDYVNGLARRNMRIRYFRHAENSGPQQNFIKVLSLCTGKYFMWLGDDDWIDPTYVDQCVAILEKNSDCSIVYGRTRYFNAGTLCMEEPATDYLHNSLSERVLAYYSHVSRNGMFYGMMRREQLATVDILNALSDDWLLVASVLCKGKAKGIDSVCVNRMLGGATKDIQSVVSSSTSPKWVAFDSNTYHLAIAINVFSGIAWRSKTFGILRWQHRLALAWNAAEVIRRRYEVNALMLVTKYLARMRQYIGLRTHLRKVGALLVRKESIVRRRHASRRKGR